MKLAFFFSASPSARLYLWNQPCLVSDKQDNSQIVTGKAKLHATILWHLALLKAACGPRRGHHRFKNGPYSQEINPNLIACHGQGKVEVDCHSCLIPGLSLHLFPTKQCLTRVLSDSLGLSATHQHVPGHCGTSVEGTDACFPAAIGDQEITSIA